jgi:hypothetical protein
MTNLGTILPYSLLTKEGDYYGSFAARMTVRGGESLLISLLKGETGKGRDGKGG